MPLEDEGSSDDSRPEPSLLNCMGGGEVDDDTVVVSVMVEVEFCDDWETEPSVT